MRTILLIILVLLLIGAFPAWPYSAGWGYYPAGGLGLILIIVLILVFGSLCFCRGRIRWLLFSRFNHRWADRRDRARFYGSRI
jgi:hypothetical protein